MSLYECGSCQDTGKWSDGLVCPVCQYAPSPQPVCGACGKQRPETLRVCDGLHVEWHEERSWTCASWLRCSPSG